ncbi:MAG: MFS transporter [Bacteroidetes bacterium 47-18]|nr:MAG: MFS transporter [Bacteroidetes bacterium 47-18]
MSKGQPSIYTVQFVLLCMSSLLFSASFNMMIPELPAYLSSIGGAEYKGLIIALFTLTAGISRPFSGRLTDTIGRVPIMAVGSVVCFICGFLYPVLSSVAGFLLLRLVHGFSTGFKPTATAAYIADLIPKERWGEALGFHGLCFSIGQAVGPALGSWVAGSYSINMMFYVSSAFALLSMLILMHMKETLPQKQAFRFGLLRLGRNDIVDWNVLPAALIVLLSYLSYGALLTLIPDWTHHIGISNKGFFFIVFTLSSILVRMVAGRLSDKYGRIKVINTGLTGLAIAMMCIAFSKTMAGLTISSALFGLSMGILGPALNAWTIDLSHPDHRGKAMATMYIALEIGIGGGALCAGWLYQDVISHIPKVFIITGIIAVIALMYMLVRVKDGKSLSGSRAAS